MKRVHPIMGLFALVLIGLFWGATVLSELIGPEAFVIDVKTSILWGLLLLIPALAMTGGSGFSLARKHNGVLVRTKQKRMKVIGLNGVFVLVPCAVYLASKAETGAFDQTFYAAQGVELVAGAVNIALLGLNLRDGLKLRGQTDRL